MHRGVLISGLPLNCSRRYSYAENLVTFDLESVEVAADSPVIIRSLDSQCSRYGPLRPFQTSLAALKSCEKGCIQYFVRRQLPTILHQCYPIDTDT